MEEWAYSLPPLNGSSPMLILPQEMGVATKAPKAINYAARCPISTLTVDPVWSQNCLPSERNVQVTDLATAQSLTILPTLLVTFLLAKSALSRQLAPCPKHTSNKLSHKNL